MTESRFQFLQGDFPELFARCEDASRATEAHAALLKARMALEHMAKDLGAKQRDLFNNINELNDLGVLDAKRSRLFHQVRRIANLGVHEGNEIGAADVKSCLDALFEIALWYAISFKQRRYELAAFETPDLGLVKQYLSNEASKDGKTAAAGAAQDVFSNSIDPLQIDGDFSRQMAENQETDEFKQDVFETDEEYAKRIAAMPKVHLGYAILDARRQDGYTKIVFPLHHIDRNDRIHFSNHIRAFYAEDITGHDVIDDELVCGLRVFDKQVYCNYSTIALKHGTEEIPMHPICWEKFPYETERDLQHRIAHMPILPLGFCLPDRNSYDIHTQQLTFAVKPFAYVKEKLMSPSITLKFNRDVARKICTWNRPYKIFGQLKGDKASFLLWDKELGVFYDGLDAHDHKGKQTKEQPQSRAEMFAVLDGSIEELLQLGKKYLEGQGSQKDIRKGLECYKKAAEKGSLEAQLALGDRYRQGTEIEKDEQEAFRWYWQAAGQGNVDAQFWLGYAYDHGRGVEQDYKKAVIWYRKAAEQGEDAAQNNLGCLYYYGRGVAQDYQEALKWFQEAAQHGNDTAQIWLGSLYDYGQGVKQDYKEAMKWYQKAAGRGNSSVPYWRIGLLYYWGRGVQQDYQEAMKWYQKAADQGNASAQNDIGDLYYNGNGVKQDYEEAMKWYRKAAAQGNASAQRSIGYMYDYGKGVEQDYEEAMKWYRKAAAQGDAIAQNNIGYLYHHGRGVTVDYQEAMKWYKKAAAKGDDAAQNNIGNLYCLGNGVKQDYEEAMKWYRKAAAQGNATAQNNIGYMYDYGQGVEQDYEEAMKWYRKAADQSNAFAQHNIGELYQHGQGVKQDYKEAMKWYQKSAAQGNAFAQNSIGNLYYNGNGVKQDYEEAMKWYQKAIEQGNDDAKENLARVREKISQAGTSQKKSSGCFITTAVCQCFGKSDDCYELTMFRHFRDNWLMQQPDGKALIAEYYATAPAIVSCIDGREHPADIYQQIWQRYLSPCLKHLEQGEYKACKERYIAMVCTLKAKYY
ncbi:CFI-box-CTERM domain-containing protein [Mitsuokella jalaludinii]|uniref:CFI-box-CTERM domain-containing protein n=1 Tax=Mitsuokella jalaludinii TaxID=187979 RepID=UPI003F9E8A82